MKQELDNYLCTTYPKLFKNRHGDMKETLMCWGFECGDGWFNILNQLCGDIQSHIDWRNNTRQRDLQKKEAYDHGYEALVKFFQGKLSEPTDYDFQNAERTMREGVTVQDEIPQVVVEQVKEKFGTLRFYYQGGDEYINGLARMAESMSGVMCEECGSPGTTNGGGWVRTLCEKHEADYQARRNSND